ncbi:MAG: hypothetical protein Athens071426_327 [Parcubacteria group bacterium Athens0714_26]|nr:MAG: hypothetical protein Athens101426_94 [Parcubacteria group bacterium Athens1014_26]TSD03031.1 MAG: hypothetical protein Athens071426_327 [Parcubacteria group bacterium Athens0714_26]
MSDRTIFFVVATKTRINFILRTDLFRILKEKNFKIVIVSPFWNQKEFIEEFGGDNVIFESLYDKMTRLYLMLAYWRGQALKINHPKIKFGIRIHGFITRRFVKTFSFFKSFKTVLRGIIFLLIPKKFRESQRFWDRLLSFFILDRCANWLFRKYQPLVLIVASGGAEGRDVPFLLSAQKYSVASVVIDNNIDAPQFRYFSPPFEATKWAVFGVPGKKELEEFQQIKPSKLTVTGPLRYDYYFKEFKPTPREIFFKEIGADPQKKLITFGAKIPVMYPHNADIIKIILKGIKDNYFNQPAQLFVRFDPRHDPQFYPQFLNEIVYECAEIASGREHIANLLYHSDVVISIVSTFCIEACLVGTPAIWIGFDGLVKYESYEESTRFQYDLDCFKRIIDTGAIPLAENFEELIILIKKYLLDKSLDREKRKKMIEQEYFKTDGRAGERIAKMVIDFVS